MPSLSGEEEGGDSPRAAMTVTPCAATRYLKNLLNCVLFPFCSAAVAAPNATTVAKIPSLPRQSMESRDQERWTGLRRTDGDERLFAELAREALEGGLVHLGRGGRGPHVVGGGRGRRVWSVRLNHDGWAGDRERAGLGDGVWEAGVEVCVVVRCAVGEREREVEVGARERRNGSDPNDITSLVISDSETTDLVNSNFRGPQRRSSRWSASPSPSSLRCRATARTTARPSVASSRARLPPSSSSLSSPSPPFLDSTLVDPSAASLSSTK